jgi:hypothetical protein
LTKLGCLHGLTARWNIDRQESASWSISTTDTTIPERRSPLIKRLLATSVGLPSVSSQMGYNVQ